MPHLETYVKCMSSFIKTSLKNMPDKSIREENELNLADLKRLSKINTI